MAIESLLGDLHANWETTTLGEICQRGGGSIQTGPFGSQLHASDYVEVGIPSIMPQNIGNNRVVPDGIARITEKDAKRLGRYLVKNGDIVYSRRGDVERRALITKKEDGWLCGTGCLRVRFGASDFIDSQYASFYLGDLSVREWVVRHAIGATMPNLNTSILSALPFVVPPLSEQRAIAGVLGALDDKIEVNRRMNVTLESMARAVFLEMVKDGGGEEKTIGDVVTVAGGSTPSTTNPVFWNDGNINWATPKDLAPLKSPFLLETNSWITELGLQDISSGLLPVGTVLLSSRAPIGYLAITQIPVAINQGFIAIKCTEEVPNYFMLNWLKVNMEEIIGRANGTTFLEISKSNFRPMKMFVPSPERMKEFVETVEPLYQKVVANLKESRTLASLRDSLLPKLMRGEVRVKDVEI
jgi:type I restriction enzyme S subunit